MIAFPFFDSFIGSGHKFSDPADVKIRRLEIQSVRPDLKTQEKGEGLRAFRVIREGKISLTFCASGARRSTPKRFCISDTSYAIFHFPTLGMTRFRAFR